MALGAGHWSDPSSQVATAGLSSGLSIVREYDITGHRPARAVLDTAVPLIRELGGSVTTKNDGGVVKAEVHFMMLPQQASSEQQADRSRFKVMGITTC